MLIFFKKTDSLNLVVDIKSYRFEVDVRATLYLILASLDQKIDVIKCQSTDDFTIDCNPGTIHIIHAHFGRTITEMEICHS